MEDKLIPCTYIGDVEVLLAHFGGPYLDGDGKPLADLVLRKGSTLMMRESEVNGMTIKFDPRGLLQPEVLGVGVVIKNEDKDKAQDVLAAEGYQFHAGREDFEPVVTVVEAAPAQKE